MSELIQQNDDRATIRWKLLTGASALALTAYIASTNLAGAEDADRPTLWIELGGQMELMQGTSSPFTAPFFTFPTSAPDFRPVINDSQGHLIDPWPTSRPDSYGKKSFAQNQSPSRFAFGGNARITLQPEGSDWSFSAAIRYGRSHDKRHRHYQSPPNYVSLGYPYTGFSGAIPNEAFSDTLHLSSEHHAVLDFTVGKDVGLGILGSNGTSTVSAGVRYAQFTSEANTKIIARPSVYGNGKHGFKYRSYFHSYYLTGHQARSFKGIGPSISWKASAALAGNADSGELMLDWGIDAAVLFGRQKAKTDHETHTYRKGSKYAGHTLYPARSYNAPLRSRRVTVPNIGGSIGLSMVYPNAKVSVGYRGDIFFKAMDTGIDAAKKSNLTFNGPYASISIGLGD